MATSDDPTVRKIYHAANIFPGILIGGNPVQSGLSLAGRLGEGRTRAVIQGAALVLQATGLAYTQMTLGGAVETAFDVAGTYMIFKDLQETGGGSAMRSLKMIVDASGEQISRGYRHVRAELKDSSRRRY